MLLSLELRRQYEVPIKNKHTENADMKNKGPSNPGSTGLSRTSLSESSETRLETCLISCYVND